MKSLTGSALNLSLVKCNDQKSKGCFVGPRNVVLSKPDVHVLGCAKNVNVVGLSLSGGLSQQRDRFHPILCASSFSSSETHVEDEEMQMPDENQSKTVRVKFQLQKECLFGQQFSILGDDPILGLWDPLEAIPLTWTAEHVWTVELALPIGSLIKYKFILKGDEGTIFWQPGEDRVLQTWDTMKTITVIEDWDDAQVQKVLEEEYQVVDSDLVMVAENLTQSSDDASFSISGEKLSSESTVAANTTELNGEVKLSDSRTETYPKESEVGEVNNTLKTNGRSMNGEHFSLGKDEFPVLVPGLIPMAAALQNEESSSSSLDVANGNGNAEADGVSLGSADKAEVAELNMKDEHSTETSDPQQTIELVLNDKQELQEEQQIEMSHLAADNVLEGDFQWGRKTLQKLLMNFGLL